MDIVGTNMQNETIKDESNIEYNKNNRREIDVEWTTGHENILIDWADKAMCYRWLHSQANNKFSILSKWFTIPVIIISTLTGTANFAQDRVSRDYVSYFVMGVGTLNIIAGIITTVQQFLKINELNESHRISSIAWDKFYRNIKIELAKHPKERHPVTHMIKLCKEEFDRLMETSPVIQSDIIAKFNTTFKNTSSFMKIKKPEICDELISTETFRFVGDKTPNNKNIFGEIHRRTKVFENNKKIINEFIENFKKAQDREPQRDEVKDALKDKGITDSQLERALNDVLKKTSDDKYSSLTPRILTNANTTSEIINHAVNSSQNAKDDISEVLDEPKK